MRVIENPFNRITGDQKNYLFYLLIPTGLILIILFSFFLGQVYIAFAGIIIIIALFVFFRSPIGGIMIILVASATTGFFNRLALYLSGTPAPIDYIRFGIELLIIIFGARLLITRPIKNHRLAVFVDVSVWAYLIFSTIYTINLIYVGPLVTFWGWRWTCLPIIMYFIGRRLGYSQYFVEIFFKTIILLLLLLSGYAIYQAAVGLPFFEKLWFSLIPAADRASAIIEGSMFIAGKPRLPSLTSNHVSFTLLAGYLFILILLIPKKFLSNPFRILRLVTLISTTIYLFLTLERSAVAMIIVGLFSVVFLSFRKHLGRISWVLVLIIIVLGLTTMSLIDVNTIPWTQETIAFRRVVELTNPFQANTFRGRATSVWPVAFDRLKANPLGYGLGTFHTTSQNQTLGYSFFIPPHNMYLQIALEIGIIGFVIFIVLIFSYIRLLIKAYVIGREKKLVFTAFSSLAAVLAVGIVNYPLEPPLAFFFWLFTGITTSYLIIRNQHQTEEVIG